MSTVATSFGIEAALEALGLSEVNQGTSTGTNWFSNGPEIESYSPVDGQLIGKVTTTTREDYDKVMATATEAFKSWRVMPAPQRGEIVRQFGEEYPGLKDQQGRLVFYGLVPNQNLQPHRTRSNS